VSGREVLPDLIPRIRAATEHAKDADDHAKLLYRQRDELIVSAVDAGIAQRAVAEAAGISKSRVVAILGDVELWDVV